MECEFVYAFVPRNDIEVTLQMKAEEKARRILLKAETHMELEDQKVKEDQEKRIKALAKQIIEKGKIW